MWLCCELLLLCVTYIIEEFCTFLSPSWQKSHGIIQLTRWTFLFFVCLFVFLRENSSHTTIQIKPENLKQALFKTRPGRLVNRHFHSRNLTPRFIYLFYLLDVCWSQSFYRVLSPRWDSRLPQSVLSGSNQRLHHPNCFLWGLEAEVKITYSYVIKIKTPSWNTEQTQTCWGHKSQSRDDKLETFAALNKLKQLWKFADKLHFAWILIPLCSSASIALLTETISFLFYW